MDGERQHSRTHSMHVPLNLVSLTTGQLHSLGTTLGELWLGTVSDLMLMIEGKVTEGDCNPLILITSRYCRQEVQWTLTSV